jgi:Tfp pilus assembly pilus retraction ATPase PilT
MNILDIFSAILSIAEAKKYSDVHINTGNLPIIRDANGDIIEV